MRITSGSARGRILQSVPGEETRPTSDMVKQAMFNILQFEIAGRRVLDLFSGTGQLALEALSRGASSAVMVDSSPEAVSVINANVSALDMRSQARVVKSDYKAFLHTVSPKSFDLVFLDPPYRDKFISKLLGYCDSYDILSDVGIIVCEMRTGDRIPEETDHLVLTHLRKYGGTSIAVYRKKANEN